MIEGVVIQELKQIVDTRGRVMHMLRADSPLFTRFGEIYFSVVNPGVVKAWKCHPHTTQHLAVPVGRIRLVLYDDRQNANSYGQLEVMDIGEDNYVLVRIPPSVWYGFRGMSKTPALIANCIDHPYKESQAVRLAWSVGDIPYRWETEDK